MEILSRHALGEFPDFEFRVDRLAIEAMTSTFH